MRICTTTVFVDPYEEADAQVRRVPRKSRPWWLGAEGHTRRLSLLYGGEKTQPWVLCDSLATSQIAQERKKTQHQVDPEAKAKTNQPQPGNQGPQTYRQGVGKYINPAAT